jgi:hypothetical protein
MKDNKTMKVIIPRCSEHEGYPANAIEVEISIYCPICGGKRGKPFDTISYDGSRRLHVQGWNNPCGHVDRYSSFREEIKNQLQNTN